MARRGSMLGLLMAADAAEHRAWAQRSLPPRVQRLFINYDGYVEGVYVCEDEERVCRELLWALNDALERLGYTMVWKLWPRYRRFEFKGYKRVEEMLPIPGSHEEAPIVIEMHSKGDRHG